MFNLFTKHWLNTFPMRHNVSYCKVWRKGKNNISELFFFNWIQTSIIFVKKNDFTENNLNTRLIIWHPESFETACRGLTTDRHTDVFFIASLHRVFPHQRFSAHATVTDWMLDAEWHFFFFSPLCFVCHTSAHAQGQRLSAKCSRNVVLQSAVTFHFKTSSLFSHWHAFFLYSF